LPEPAGNFLEQTFSEARSDAGDASTSRRLAYFLYVQWIANLGWRVMKRFALNGSMFQLSNFTLDAEDNFAALFETHNASEMRRDLCADYQAALAEC
jgi:hypothetical protein